MSSFVRKNLYLCFSKVKCLPPLHDLENNDRRSTSSPTSTPTSVLHNTPSSAVATSDDQFSSPSSSSFDDSDFLTADTLPDLTTVYASRRFFFSSPGQSNSIIESCVEDAEAAPAAMLPGTRGVAVSKYSPDPLADFRRSMQEMVDARELKDVKEDWDYLHELLLCYLRLNPKHTHKYIIGAFTDLIISLMSRSELDKGDKSGVNLGAL